MSKFSDGNVIDLMDAITPRSRFADEHFELPALLKMQARSKFADPVKETKPEPKLSDFTPFSMAWLDQRYIEEMDSRTETKLGESHRYQLRRHQREPFGAKDARTLTEDDFIEYFRWRRKDVCASTAMQDFTYMHGVLKYAKASWRECRASIKPSVMADVKPFLVKQRIIGKSTPRDRRTKAEEKAALRAYFSLPSKANGFRRQIDMVRMMDWQEASGRRVGESCALLWLDWNPEDYTILVRKMKDPKNKNKQKVVALTNDAQAMLYDMAYEMDAKPELRTNEPRILPYRSKSVSAAYTHAKKPGKATPEGIKNLRLHDRRRDCASTLLEKGYTVRQVMMVTGHERETGSVNTYTKPDPATFKNGPLGQQPAQR